VDEGLLETVECQVQIDGISVHGRVADVLPDRLPRLRIGKLNAGTVVRNGLDWLLLCAAGQPRQLWQLYLDDEGDLGPHLRPALGQQQARQALARLVDFYLAGMQQPLAYAPRTALAIFQAEEESVPRRPGRAGMAVITATPRPARTATSWFTADVTHWRMGNAGRRLSTPR
jgi:Exonuclease V gamma subunit